MAENDFQDKDQQNLEQDEVGKVDKLPERPGQNRVFYANTITWLFTEGQEAVLDFKLGNGSPGRMDQ